MRKKCSKCSKNCAMKQKVWNGTKRCAREQKMFFWGEMKLIKIQWEQRLIFCGTLWYWITVCSLVLPRVVIYGLAWPHMALHCLIWPCMIFHGLVCLVWSYVVLYGLVWSCMVLCGLVWSYVAMCGLVSYDTDSIKINRPGYNDFLTANPSCTTKYFWQNSYDRL